MSLGSEWAEVEKPLLDQLRTLGWQTLDWSKAVPTDRVGRATDRDTLLEERLRDAIRRINPGPDATAWLDDTRVNAAVAELRSMPAGIKLLEANRKCTDLLLRGVSVPGLEGWNNGRLQTIDYIDWDDPAANDFLAVSQFAIGTPGTAKDIRPDITLFVNGIPLVVIEAKAPGNDGLLASAVEQLRRYANQRESQVAEGSERLFWTNQFTVVTNGDRAEAGTFTALAEHYVAWKDPYPATLDEVATAQSTHADQLTQQEVLTAGMLAPERLLDIVRHFTLFQELDNGQTAKVVCRYQQYRGVQKAIHRMLTGTTRKVDGSVDRRGGIIWHTQGSGKSLTMVFLIRAMRSHPVLRRFKIVLVTDRKDLQRQLADTAALTGETIRVGRNAREVKDLLSQPGPGVVMAMIQKYRDSDTAGAGGNTTSGDDEALRESDAFGLLNDSEDILVMVDEAHRSHASTLHASLMNALPNAARIGFTGTPIIMGKRKMTETIFGGYLDRYTLRESEDDHSTVPILYEGFTTEATVKGASKMDDVFFRWFSELTDEQREILQTKYATTAKVLESPEMIAAKAASIVRHYVSTVMPEGFKAMLVASSREACLRYYDALNTARDALVADVEREAPELVERRQRGAILRPDEQFLVDAARQLDMIRALMFAPIISGDHNDPASYMPWTDGLQQAERIRRFSWASDRRTLGLTTASTIRSPSSS